MRTIYQKKMIKIGILVMIIGGLSIGFATFSNSLTIKSNSTISADPNNFKIMASASEDSVDNLQIVPSFGDKNGTATPATINNSGNVVTITGLSATFTRSIYTANYKFYIHNIGKYKAYLQNIKNLNRVGDAVCTPGEGATESLVQEACKNLSVQVCIPSISNYCTLGNWSLNTPFEIEIGATLEVTIKIDNGYYKTIADGPYSTKFNDVEFEFRSVA